MSRDDALVRATTAHPTMHMTTANPDATLAIGRALGRHAGPGACLGLSGPLGAGKTLLTRGVFEGMGFREESWSGSPTFVLACRYEGRGEGAGEARVPLVHADFYRLGSSTEARELALAEQAGEGAALVVEWADRFPEALPVDRLEVVIEATGAEERRLAFEATRPGAAEWLARALGRGVLEPATPDNEREA